MVFHALLHLGIARGAFFRRHGGDFFRVFESADPTFEVFAIEEGLEAFGWFVVVLRADRSLEERDLNDGEERKETKPEAGGERSHVSHLKEGSVYRRIGGAGKF